MHAVQLFHNYENSYALLASSYFRIGMLKQVWMLKKLVQK